MSAPAMKTLATVTDLTAAVRKAELEQFKRYSITLRFIATLHGGIPKTTDMIGNWVKSRVSNGELGEAEAERIKAEYREEMKTAEAVEEDEAKNSWRGFRSDAAGIYLEARQVKALFKEVSTVAGLVNSVRGSRQVWQHGAIITAPDAVSTTGSEKLRLTREMSPILEPDGFEESVVHAMTPQGPRSSIKRNDFVRAGAELSFALWVLDRGKADNAINDDYVVRALAAGQQNGLGADRSQGCGRFEVVSCTVEPHEPPAWLRQKAAKKEKAETDE